MTRAADPPTAFQDCCTRADGLPAVPLVLGVVGEGPLDANGHCAVRDALKKTFDEFQIAYPNSPIVLLTALAEGAEQLAAETALEQGHFVRVPLPSVPDIYRQSAAFQSEAGRRRLDELLADAPKVESFIVPLPAPAQLPPPEAGWDVTANAAGYLVRRCHALIAVSNGAPIGRVAECVACKLEGRPFADYPWTDAHPLGFRSDRGPVILVRLSGSEAVREVRVPNGHQGATLPFASFGDVSLPEGVHPLRHFVHRVLGSLNWVHSAAELQQFRDICQAVDHFNRDVVGSCQRAQIREELRQLAAALPREDLLAEPHVSRLRRMNAVRAAAELVSQELQPLVNAAVFLVFALLGVSILCFHFYAHPISHSEDEHHPRALLAASVVFLLLTIAVVAIAWVKRLDERRLDYRALAESLRVRCAWATAGIGASVADSYLGQLRGEMIWARLALQHIAPPPRYWAEHFDTLAKERQLERLRLVQKDWVRGQKRYLHKAHGREHVQAAWLRRIGFGLFLAGLAGMVWLLGWHDDAEHWHLILFPMLLVAGGLLVAYGERRSHEELSKQYARMHVVFDDGDRELSAALAAGNIKRAQAVLEMLGHEAISEHAQWLILRRARPVELQLGG